MTPSPRKLVIGGHSLAAGETWDLYLDLTQAYSGEDVQLPVRVVRAAKAGPTLLLTAAVHGDEINGTGVIRELILNPPFELARGTLVLVPVVNIPGFERRTRYMPDRRDLNRCFPGLEDGSLSSRIAHTVFEQIVRSCDYCIDFHTAAVHRTNFPNVRGDLGNTDVRRIAEAFGASLLLDSKGLPKTLRSAATDAGCATIVIEAGEVWKVEPAIVEFGVRGVSNVLGELEMIEWKRTHPPYRAHIDRRRWLRSDAGGMLRFHARPGDVLEQGQPIASCLTLLGEERGTVVAPEDGIVVGSTTLPAVKPGDPVCHFGSARGGIKPILAALKKVSQESLHERLRGDLGSSITLEESDPQ
ncbi:MAG: succinylglutamate desuccinylase/aspartoacylase family protein [Thermoleophilia bacterium]|nr:succinylglutamate desuccinylase/aspartoacylase family protein [Thermoleophilia bacterium]